MISGQVLRRDRWARHKNPSRTADDSNRKTKENIYETIPW